MRKHDNYISIENSEIVIVDPSLRLIAMSGPLLIGLVSVTVIAAIITPDAFGQLALIEITCLAALAIVIGIPHFDLRRRRFISTPKNAFVANRSFIMAPDDRIAQRLWDWPERIAWSEVRAIGMEHRPTLLSRLRPLSSHLVLQLKDGRTKRVLLPWITGEELGSVVAVLFQIAELHGIEARLRGAANQA